MSGVRKQQMVITFNDDLKGTELEEVSSDIDRKLLEISQVQTKTSEALLCLRCRVSHPITEKIRLLFNQFRQNYDLELIDMLVCVLNDNGDHFLRVSQKQEDGKIETLREPFSWGTLKKLSRKEIKPFAAEVIYNFEPNLSSLSTWAKNKVQANRELKQYLRSNGLLLITPWALIADSTPTRVKEAWQRCGQGNLKFIDVELLHNSYVSQYKHAKELHKKLTGKISGWVPDSNFLASLNPSQKDRNNLLAIDKAIRQYLAGTSFARQFEEGEEFQIESPHIDSDENINEDLLKSIHQALERSAIPIIKNAIEIDSARWEKDPSRKLAWELYAQGLSQRDIAIRCEHKQGWVSKLLAEKSLSENIAQEAAVDLIRRPEFRPVRKDPEGVDRMIEQLKNYLVSSEQQKKVPLLRTMIRDILNK
tara:strand:- start:2018 stop:3280 length:1263 start_codon:yes stop_codon:yes gene_type:complete